MEALIPSFLREPIGENFHPDEVVMRHSSERVCRSVKRCYATRFRLARVIGAGLLALILLVWSTPSLPQAASSPTMTSPASPASLYHTYWARNRPVITGWITAEAFFYDLGVPMPLPYSEPLYIDPRFEEWILRMRPAILESARRHNHPAISGMDDRQFAVVLAAILYLENNAALNDRLQPARAVTPVYQNLQVSVNRLGIGTDFSILPANLRPSVAINILQGKVPLPPNSADVSVVYRPIIVHGSRLQEILRATPVVDGWTPSFDAVTQELVDDRLAIEYLAANLEIALYRCHYEWVPVSWATLVAWTSRGVVSPYAIRATPGAGLAIARLERYLPLAVKLIYNPPRSPHLGPPGLPPIPG